MARGQPEDIPRELVEFLEKLYAGPLAFRKDHMEVVKKLMVVEENACFASRAKTG